jgi:UDP-glucose 6-dehydrogenase
MKYFKEMSKAKPIALWGLSFKTTNDDMTPSLYIVKHLLKLAL